jgi:two-component SAPR family response regulator
VPEDALARCRVLGLRTLEAWALVTMAVAATGTPTSAVTVAAADSAARRGGLRALQGIVDAASPAVAGDPAVFERAASLAEVHGIVVPEFLARSRHDLAPPSPIADDARTSGNAVAPTPATELRIQCLGRFEVCAAEGAIDLTELRPRARTVLRMLAAHLDAGIHRQMLCEHLWPDDDEAAAARKLQVTISSIRRTLELAGAPDVVRRRDDVYLLDRRRVVCDADEFTKLVAEARLLLARGESSAGAAALRRAQEIYMGDLLTEDGAAEWVIGARQQLHLAATDAAFTLATMLVNEHQPGEAVGVCRWGLAVDRFHDPLWRLLLTAMRARGDLAGHARASAAYDAMLAELGVQCAPDAIA